MQVQVLLLVSRNLPFQSLYRCISSSFERSGIFLAEERAARHHQLNFYGFIRYAVFVVEAQDYFSVGNTVVEVVELIETLLNKVEQFLVGIEMHRLHLHFHGQKKLSGKRKLLSSGVSLFKYGFQAVDGQVRVHLCGR
jgi:hypothetical protein